MLKNIRAGQTPGHDYEHQGEDGHDYPDSKGQDDDIKRDLTRGFGVLMEGISAGDYLNRLEGVDFNPFAVRSSWKLPWKMWQASRTQQL